MSVRELIQRVEAHLVGGVPLDWRKIRSDIHEEHERAMTTADRVALLDIHKALMDAVERGAGFTAADMEKCQGIGTVCYLLLPGDPWVCKVFRGC
jgi:hypothetical protein